MSEFSIYRSCTCVPLPLTHVGEGGEGIYDVGVGCKRGPAAMGVARYGVVYCITSAKPEGIWKGPGWGGAAGPDYYL